MSNNGFNTPARGRTGHEIPRGDEVASFPDSHQAQEAVAELVKAEFPAKQVAIIGSGLKSIERVTGALSFGKIALNGAGSGVWLGLIASLFIFVISPEIAETEMILAVIFIVAGLGAVISVLLYQLNRRRRTYTSVLQVTASDYTLVVAPGMGGKARSILGISAPRPPQSPASSASSVPPSGGSQSALPEPSQEDGAPAGEDGENSTENK